MELQIIFSLSAFLLPLLFFVLLAKEFGRRGRYPTAQKLPPGPWKLPFIGNLHLMVGSLPHHALKKLADKHGPLMHLQLGELSTIVITSPRLAKEVLQVSGLAFANRPQLTVTKYVSYNSLGVSFSQYGDYWRQIRQMYVMELLSTEKVKSFFTLMEEELRSLVQSIEKQEGQQFILREKIISYLYSMISRCIVGRICKDKDALIRATREAASLAGVFNVADLFPSVKILQVLGGQKTKLESMLQTLDDILENIVIEHETNSISIKAGNDNSMKEDIVDVLLRHKSRNDRQFPITSNNIKAIIFELFVAGTVTSSTVVEWAMSEMIKNPRVMQKTKAELRQAFNGKKMISGSDLKHLRYLKLVIKETLRLHPPGPLLAPRECRETCEIEGYSIPEKTIAIVNVWAIGRDPKYWHDPEKFDPDRFSNSSIELTGNHFELIPFGAGRRICPGISFGLANVELLLSQLLYRFDWKLPRDINPLELDMTEKAGAAAVRKNALHVIANIRVPSEGSID